MHMCVSFTTKPGVWAMHMTWAAFTEPKYVPCHAVLPRIGVILEMASKGRSMYYLLVSICLLMILLLHLSPQPSQYPCIPQSGGCSDCAFAGMIERLWLPPSGIATLALCSVLFFCVCSCATRARNSHRALASVAACTCSFLWSSAMMLVYVAPQSVRPVLLLKTALAFAYRGQCAITCSLVSVYLRRTD